MCLQAFEKRLWPHGHALRQFERALQPELLTKLEDRGFDLDRLWDMEASEIGAALRHPSAGGSIRACLEAFPSLSLEARVQPVTRCQSLILPTWIMLCIILLFLLKEYCTAVASRQQHMHQVPS